MDKPSRSVGRNIRRLREDDGLTLELVAEQVSAELGYDVSLNTVSKIERGVRKADVDELVAFARVFRTSEAYLLADPDDRLAGEASAIVGQWSRARSERRTEVLRLDRAVEGQWEILVEYAGQSAEKRAAIERVLVRAMGDDEVGRPMGERLVGKLGDDLAAS